MRTITSPTFWLLCAATVLVGCGNDTGGGGADSSGGTDVGGTIDANTDDTASDEDGVADTSTGADTSVTDIAVSDVPSPGDVVPGDVLPNDTATEDTATEDTTSTDTTDAQSDASGGVQCNGPKGSFPAFAKACKGDADCFVAQHQINCCGTKVAIGLAVVDKAAFAAAEAVCQSQYPGCGCAQFETMAEDGYSSFSDADFQATCVAGLCRASVPSGKAICGAGGLQSPKAVKSCTATSDCTYVLQTIDCCGSQRAVGIAKFAKDALEKAEFSCSQQMAVCDCMPKPVQLEDGLTAGDGLTAVQCEAGSCMTYAK